MRSSSAGVHALLCFVVLWLCSIATVGQAPAMASASAPAAIALSGDAAGAHDPSMIHAGDTWYVFTTGKAADGGVFGVRCSPDLHAWQNCGHVFDTIPRWIQQRSPETKELWAPDISFEHGEFRLYYAYSAFGKNTSGIALATNTTLDRNSPTYKWQDKGLVLESKAEDNFNAIDPNYFEDKTHHAWLDFGSFWSGIKMRALDATTGLLATTDTKLYSLASRGSTSPAEPHAPGLPPDTQAVEAPFIVTHGGYFYLFTSFDLCCRGTKSTYRTVVGRSQRVTGPYVDQTGVPLTKGGGTNLLIANARWLGPGGESVVMGSNGQPDLLVYHAYDATSGKPSLQLSTITWQDGWPHAALAQ
jgi:arabinan endo-1,5-alpha-L-arabinosidase